MPSAEDIVNAWENPPTKTVDGGLIQRPTGYLHVMTDLETTDNVPSSAIASIGACTFDANGIYDDFYVVVDVDSCYRRGMTYSQDTLDWWAKQSPEARKIFDPETFKHSIEVALGQFYDWFKRVNGKEMWGNGADFDNAILAHAYRKCGGVPPWRFPDSRCFRTIKNGAYMPAVKRVGTYHNALDDARTQAQFMIDRGLVPVRA